MNIGTNIDKKLIIIGIFMLSANKFYTSLVRPLKTLNTSPNFSSPSGDNIRLIGHFFKSCTKVV